MYLFEADLYVGEPQLVRLASPVGPSTALQLQYRYEGPAKRLRFQVAAADDNATSCHPIWDNYAYAPYSSRSTEYLTIGESAAVVLGMPSWAAVCSVWAAACER